ncbi:MAG: CoA transferase, partial [Gammaproteobacteria bacterium]|nr:CoA transferase [Gammaproteobacteria bacterium]
AHPSITPYGGFVTGDGVTLVISVQNDREWQSFATNVMGRPELVEDPCYATNPARLERREVVDGMVQEFFGRHTRAEMEDKLRSARIAYGAVNDVTGLSTHPHLRRLTVDSETGDVEVPAHPNAAAAAPKSPRLPRLGEHNELIRQEFSD